MKTLIVIVALLVGAAIGEEACAPSYTTDPAVKGVFTNAPTSVPAINLPLPSSNVQLRVRGTTEKRDGPAPLVGETGHTQAFGITKTRDDNLYILPLSAYIVSGERGVSHRYTVAFQFRQNPKNSIENKPSPPTAIARISVGFVPKSLVTPTTTFDQVVTAMNAASGFVNAVGANGAVDGKLFTFTTDTSVWQNLNVTFTPASACTNCSLVLRVAAPSWISWWANDYLLDNVVLSRAAVTSFPPQSFTDGSHEKVTLRYAPPVTTPANRTACPFQIAGAKPWHSPSTWPSGKVPTAGADVTLPENTVVIIQSCSLLAAPYGVITIPKSSVLVFDDADIEIHITQIFVYGALKIGSETCRYFGRIKIVFHGVRAAVLNGQSPSTAKWTLPSKGIVAPGGQVDLHGKLYDRTWTRLATSAYAGEDRITLQHPVNWDAGMEVAVITTSYFDKPDDHKNDRVIVAAVSRDGKTVSFTTKLKYDHYAGPEYQAEATLLSRRISLESDLKDSDADKFGGHVLITSAGSGRFSGIELIRMGQQNVMGRYPLHYHMLDDTTIDNNSTVVIDAPSPAVNITGALNTVTAQANELFLYEGTTYLQSNRADGKTSASATYSFKLATTGKHNIYVTYNRLSATDGWNSVPVTVTVGAGAPVVFRLNQSTKDPRDTRKKWEFVATIDVPATATGKVTVTISNVGAPLNKIVRFDAVKIAPLNPSRSYARDVSVHDSYWRCITVHGTNGVTLSRNSGFNIQGSCYYLEDGVEERNIIEYNLAAHVHVIGRPAAGDNQPGENFVQSDSLQNPADSTATGLYVSNARNWVYGNAASGGWVGIAFPNFPKPIGMYAGSDFGEYNPLNRPQLAIDGNTAHSAGYYWSSGSCVYVGAWLSIQGDGKLKYNTGRNSRTTINTDGSTGYLSFNNTLLALCNKGLQHWGNNVEVVNYEIHDSAHGAVLFGDCFLNNALVNARTANTVGASSIQYAAWMGIDRLGFQFYDTWVRTMLDNVTFRNFGAKDSVFLPMIHSDQFKPQGISAVKGIRYENVVAPVVINSPAWQDTGSAFQYSILDFTGSAVMKTTPSIIGSFNDWWYAGSDCKLQWNVWVCDWTADRGVAWISMNIAGVSRTDAESGQPAATQHIGYACQQPLSTTTPQRYSSSNRCIVLTKNLDTTGLANRIWNYRFFGAGTGKTPDGTATALGASPKSFQINGFQIPFGNFIVTSYSYPRGTTFKITITFKWSCWPQNQAIDVPVAGSLAEILSPNETQKPRSEWVCPAASCGICKTGATGPMWFYDSNTETLYVRVVDPSMYRISNSPIVDLNFTRDGMWLNTIEGGYFYQVDASCTPLCAGKNLCGNSDNWITQASPVKNPKMILPPNYDTCGNLPSAKAVPAAPAAVPAVLAASPLPAMPQYPAAVLSKKPVLTPATELETDVSRSMIADVEDEEMDEKSEVKGLSRVAQLKKDKRAGLRKLQRTAYEIGGLKSELGRINRAARETQAANLAAAKKQRAARKQRKQLTREWRRLSRKLKKTKRVAKNKEKIGRIKSKLVVTERSLNAAKKAEREARRDRRSSSRNYRQMLSEAERKSKMIKAARRKRASQGQQTSRLQRCIIGKCSKSEEESDIAETETDTDENGEEMGVDKESMDEMLKGLGVADDEEATLTKDDDGEAVMQAVNQLLSGADSITSDIPAEEMQQAEMEEEMEEKKSAPETDSETEDFLDLAELFSGVSTDDQ